MTDGDAPRGAVGGRVCALGFAGGSRRRAAGRRPATLGRPDDVGSASRRASGAGDAGRVEASRTPDRRDRPSAPQRGSRHLSASVVVAPAGAEWLAASQPAGDPCRWRPNIVRRRGHGRPAHAWRLAGRPSRSRRLRYRPMGGAVAPADSLARASSSPRDAGRSRVRRRSGRARRPGRPRRVRARRRAKP